MISRDTAALIRYDVLKLGRPKHTVAREFDTTVSAIELIVSGQLVPPLEERVVVPPSYTPRTRVLTPEQRVKIAHLLCYGGTIQGLAAAQNPPVAPRTIQHIKDGYTVRVEEASRNSKPQRGELGHNLVAEARWCHKVQGENAASIAARHMVNYKAIWRALKGRTYKTSHGRRLNETGRMLDPESMTGKAVRLWLYGADYGFISDTTDIPVETVQVLVDAHTEPKT